LQLPLSLLQLPLSLLQLPLQLLHLPHPLVDLAWTHDEVLLLLDDGAGPGLNRCVQLLRVSKGLESVSHWVRASTCSSRQCYRAHAAGLSETVMVATLEEEELCENEIYSE
jgi:hypothetical protein